MNTIKHKGYEGSVETDVERKVLWGKILFISDLVTYEGASFDEIEAAFHEAVDDYLETCRLVGKAPEKTLKGVFNVRVTPSQHRDAVRKAVQLDIKLNEVVCRALDLFLYGQPITVQHVINNYTVSSTKTLPASAGTGKPSGAGANFSLMATGGK